MVLDLKLIKQKTTNILLHRGIMKNNIKEKIKNLDKRRVLGIILMIVGISIIVFTSYIKYESYIKEKQTREIFEKQLSNLDKDIPEPNVKDKDVEINNEDINALGIMLIPKINVKVIIAEGTDVETLKYYVGHFKDTAEPGVKGNFAVAGHRNYIYNEMFRDVHKLDSGDEIIVRTRKGEFKYKVNGSKVVEPTELSVLDQTKDATVTLITCTNSGKQRYVITGELVN